MSIRLKVFVAVATSLALAFGLLTLLVGRENSDTFAELEREDALRRMAQVGNTFHRELDTMASVAIDYARWDDTYSFVAGAYAFYVDENINPEMQSNLGMDIVIITDLEGKPLVSDIVEPGTSDVTDSKPTVDAIMTPSVLQSLAASSADAPFQAMLETPKGPAFAVAVPVTDNTGNVAPNGYFIMGRLLTPALVRELSDQLEQPLEVLPLSGTSGRAVASGENIGADTWLEPESDDQIAVTRSFNDFSGNPLLLARITAPRSLTAEGAATLRSVQLVMALTAVVALVLILLTTESAVVRPILALGRRVRDVGRSGSLSSRLPVERRDEIGTLTVDINDTLNQLEAATGRAESIASSLASGLVMADESGRIVYANVRMETLAGLTPSAIVGQPLARLSHEVSRMFEGAEALDRVIALGATEEGSKATLTAIDSEVALEVSSFRVSSGAGAPLGLGLYFLDRTEEARLDRMKSEFIAVASHELRTPLTSILGFAALLKDSAESPTARRYSSLVFDEASALNRLIADLLNVSRLESGKRPPKIESVSLREVIAAAARDAEAEFKGRSVVVQSGVDALVAADRTHLREVLANLLSNGLKYSPAGGDVTVGCTTTESEAWVTVEDEGVGIPPELMPRLFGRFDRLERADIASIAGTGLGLYVVKRLVEDMGGQITMRSVAARGTVAAFSVPLAQRMTSAA